MTAQYAVTGHPIGHSLSPRIHTLFAQQTGQDMVYEARLGDPERFPEQVREWFSQGLAGLNITLPFKEAAYLIAATRTERAEFAGAVNTLWPAGDGGLQGDNTDGAGLMLDLQRLGVTVSGRRVLILGAGGATRGILQPLLQAAPAQLFVANRTPERAVAVVERLRALASGMAADLTQVLASAPASSSSAASTPASSSTLSSSSFSAPASSSSPASAWALSSSSLSVSAWSEPGLLACALDDLPVGPFDLIINATAAGLGSDRLQLPDTLMGPSSFAYDLVYGPAAEPFLAWARAAGAVGVSAGLGMLVAQAAEAFWLWRGVRPDIAPVLQALSE